MLEVCEGSRDDEIVVRPVHGWSWSKDLDASAGAQSLAAGVDGSSMWSAVAAFRWRGQRDLGAQPMVESRWRDFDTFRARNEQGTE